MQQIVLSNNITYSVGDKLILDPNRKLEDIGVEKWGSGQNLITKFETIEPNDPWHKNDNPLIIFVFDDFFRFSEVQIIKYFIQNNLEKEGEI